eukprot:3198492-Ditylum_brightwellii.AAC.1
MEIGGDVVDVRLFGWFHWLVVTVGCGQECESVGGELCLLEWPMVALLEDALRQPSLSQRDRKCVEVGSF